MTKNILDVEEFSNNPHTYFDKYRQSSPLIELSDGRIVLIRANDVFKFLKSATLKQEDEFSLSALSGRMPSFYRFIKHGMLYSNGKIHRKRRELWGKFGRLKLKSNNLDILEPQYSALLVDYSRDGRKSSCFVSEVCQRVAEISVSTFFGIDPLFLQSVREKIIMAGTAIPLLFSEEDAVDIEEAFSNLYRLADEFEFDVDKLRLNTKHVAKLYTEISIEEIRADILLLLIAGINTTRNAVTKAFQLTLSSPVVWAKLSKLNSLGLNNVIFETLRFDSAVGAVPRVASESISVGPKVINSKDKIILSISAALQDPSLFPNPKCFLPDRNNVKEANARFGAGPHRCIGQPMAMNTISNVLRAASLLYPNSKLKQEPTEHSVFGGLRRISKLEVSLI